MSLYEDYEVALAWDLLVEAARAAARDAAFRAGPEGEAIMVSALRRNIPLLAETAIAEGTD